jgi:hypothetical protein
MNTRSFKHLLVPVSISVPCVSILVLLFTLLSPHAQAGTPSSPETRANNSLGSLARLSEASAIAFTPTFTAYLPSVATNPCGPGRTISDPANDVSPAYIDVVSLSTSLNGETLQAVFKLRDVPSQLTFDRVGVPKYDLEYGWEVDVDLDNDPQTQAEYELSASHWVFRPDSPVSRPIADGVQKNVWRYDPACSCSRVVGSATLSVDPQSDTMTLTGNIPGISCTSQLRFQTTDYNPGGAAQYDTGQ